MTLDSKLSKNLYFAGHSLGGGLAAAQSMATGRDAITFNASGVPEGVVTRHGRRNFGTDQILSHVVSGEMLNTFADGMPFMPKSNGARVDLSRHYNTLPSQPGSAWLSEVGQTKMSYGAAMSQSSTQHGRAPIMNGILHNYYFDPRIAWK